MSHLDFVVVDGKWIINGEGADIATMSHLEELFTLRGSEDIVCFFRVLVERLFLAVLSNRVAQYCV